MSEVEQAPRHHDYLFLGTHGYVLAVDKATGETVWSTSLPRTGYSIVAILYEQGWLYCASGGRLFALDPATGEVQWTNGLPGMGTGLVYLTTAESNDTERAMTLFGQAIANQRAAQQSSSGGAATTG